MGIIGKYIKGKGNRYVYASSGDVAEMEGKTNPHWNISPSKCLLLHVHGGSWFPYDCTHKFNFICEFV